MKLVATSTILHDNATYKAGDVLANLTEDEAKQLLKSGVAVTEEDAKVTQEQKERQDKERAEADKKAAARTAKKEEHEKLINNRREYRRTHPVIQPSSKPNDSNTGDDGSDEDDEDVLPVSFKTPDDEFKSEVTGEGDEAQTIYSKNGEPITEEEYRDAYAEAQADANQDGKDDEDDTPADQTNPPRDAKTGPGAPNDSNVADEEEKPSKQWNRTRLEEYATKAGMVDLDQYDTKGDLVKAIEAHQAE